MKMTNFFLTAVAVLSLGAGSLPAQNLTPGYTPPPLPPVASPQPYYAADTSAGNYELEHRIFQLEEAMKQKADKVDNTKAFDVRLNGRVFFESVTFGDPQVKDGNFSGQSDILGAREVHIGIAGSGYRIFDYSVELSHTNGDGTEFRDVFFGIKNVPGLDYVRIGYYKLETGMEYVKSGLNTTAMETPTASQSFSPGRRFGVGQTYYFANEQVRWFNGIFASTGVSAGNNKYINDPEGLIYNSRLTFVPYYAQDGARYLHFGGHYMYRENPDGRGARIGGFNRASTWFTANADASYYNQAGLEAAWGYGPLAITSELYAGSFGKGRDMYGGYVEVRYFLTGDVRPYNKRNGVAGGVRTKKNFLCVEEFIQTCHGKAKGFGIQSIGAWEVYTQWGFTDSDRIAARGGTGGRTTDLVLGLNWYLNPTTRTMFEYVHSDGTSHQSGGFRATEDIFAVGFRFNF